ncbi:MAG: hypothetical protein LC808_25830 [Actinobacteria bacterium]|nr:hypothetical protein [Actinomycetota bacterium]
MELSLELVRVERGKDELSRLARDVLCEGSHGDLHHVRIEFASGGHDVLVTPHQHVSQQRAIEERSDRQQGQRKEIDR